MNKLYIIAIACISIIVILLISHTTLIEPILPTNPNIKYVFWTGGFDSTYLVCDLLVQGYTVQPIYFNFNIDSRNLQYEKHAQYQLKQQMIRLGGHLLPTLQVSRFKLDPNVVQKMQRMTNEGWFSRPISQYTYMADYSLRSLVPIASGSECGANTILSKLVQHKLNDNNRLNDIYHNDDVGIFRNIIFPIVHITKQQMLTNSRMYKFNDILHATVSCWYPKRGNPCGRCKMCQHRII
jgi:7-cyano-7-deazaguanine synthase in queuosine biosynthesis